MAKDWKTEETANLFKAILKLRTISECEKFFRDLCTIGEIKEMAKRWKIAQMISQGMPFREIAKKTKTSTTTVSRVAHWLYYGKGGYQLVLDRFK